MLGGVVCSLFCLATGEIVGWLQNEQSTAMHHRTHSFWSPWRFSLLSDYSLPKAVRPVSKVYHWGFIDKTGKFVIAPKYENAFDFKNGYGCVTEKDPERSFDTETFIDKLGNTQVWTLATLHARYEAGLPNPQGRDKLTPERHEEELSPCEKTKNGTSRYGFSDKTGRVVFPPVYDFVSEFHDGLSLVRVNGHQQYIDRVGHTVVDLNSKYTNCGQFSEGLACAAIGAKDKFGQGAKWGFIDKTGRLTIPAQYEIVDLADPPVFVDGLAKVCIEEKKIRKFGYIDHSGKFVIQPIFNAARRFSEGLAAVSVGPLGFDAEEWNSNQDSNSRADMGNKFFRTYDLVGMPMLEVRRLLGDSFEECEVSSDARRDGCSYDSFRLTRYRCGSSDLHFEYKDGKVARYCMSCKHHFGPWTSNNQPPVLLRTFLF